MTFLAEIYRTYSAIADLLEAQELLGPSSRGVSWPRMTELHGYAFFVLLFGQLEGYVNAEYEQRIGRIEDEAFLHRVNVLYSDDYAKWNLIRSYYELRCSFAHGHAESGQLGRRIIIRKVYRDILEIMKS